MVQLKNTLNARYSKDLSRVFINEVMQLPIDVLPLQQALQMGSHALKDNMQIMITHIIDDRQDFVIITAGIFYSSLIAGCNCADDPTPVDLISEYCEVKFKIDTGNADTEVSLIE